MFSTIWLSLSESSRNGVKALERVLLAKLIEKKRVISYWDAHLTTAVYWFVPKLLPKNLQAMVLRYLHWYMAAQVVQAVAKS